MKPSRGKKSVSVPFQSKPKNLRHFLWTKFFGRKEGGFEQIKKFWDTFCKNIGWIRMHKFVPKDPKVLTPCRTFSTHCHIFFATMSHVFGTMQHIFGTMPRNLQFSSHFLTVPSHFSCLFPFIPTASNFFIFFIFFLLLWDSEVLRLAGFQFLPISCYFLPLILVFSSSILKWF